MTIDSLPPEPAPPHSEEALPRQVYPQVAAPSAQLDGTAQRKAQSDWERAMAQTPPQAGLI